MRQAFLWRSVQCSLATAFHMPFSKFDIIYALLHFAGRYMQVRAQSLYYIILHQWGSGTGLQGTAGHSWGASTCALQSVWWPSFLCI